MGTSVSPWKLASYMSTSNARILLTINDGSVPTSQFKYQPELNGPITSRPGEDLYLGTGGLPYADQNKVFDYVEAVGPGR
jgi:hypothetical protein